MIIDSNAVLFEGALNEVPKAVGLTSLHNPGKMEPVLIAMSATEALAGATRVDIKLTQADSEGGTYTDVPGAALSVTAADFVAGRRLGMKFLPRSTAKPWLKLAVTVTGTATAGKLFAALVREDDEMYEPGMYVDAGKIRG